MVTELGALAAGPPITARHERCPRQERRARELDCMAVDWSGAGAGERAHLWLAEARGGRLVRLEGGRSRAELVRHLVARARERTHVAIGLDFAFSFPAWFAREHGCESGSEVWQLVAREGEEWLRLCRPPFWGRAGRPRPRAEHERPALRATEGERLPVRGITPKSVFQIGGAGSVGTGSLRGMPHLLELARGGCAVWPFEEARLPLVLEIYPRLLSGPVNKRRRAMRELFLARQCAGQDAGLLERAAASEDAFDAAVSALSMSLHASELLRLPAARDERERLEGRIWRPVVDPATGPLAPR